MKIKIFILSCLLAIIAIHANAKDVDFSVDGFDYAITSATDLTVKVVNGPNQAFVKVPSSVVFNERTFRVTEIGNKSFHNHTELKSVDMPSITDISDGYSSVGSRYGAFSNCSNLQLVNMPSVIYIGDYAFDDCEALASVDMPVATSIGSSAFSKCISLTSVDMPAATSIGDYAFYGCSALKSVDMPAATFIGHIAFCYCHALTSVNMPAATTIGQWAFQACDALTSVDMPSVTFIGVSAFAGCSALKSVDMPAATTISEKAFYYCSALKSVDMPAVKSIGSGAFSPCAALTSVSMPAATSIGSDAFSGCKALCDIYVGEQPAVFESSTNLPFDKGTYANATLHVPAGCASKYKTTTPWGNFAFISEDYGPTGIKSTRADDVKIHTDNGFVQLIGLKEGEKVEFYSVSGQLLGAPIANGGTVSIATSEHVVICKVGRKSIKILVK